ncbi:aspartate aminotransferase family protein [Paraburkholderia atlantica]|uniref:aspartate aminotransferase family protein n=1 Tax=Paraburkholderia atlantica TaxID=2654982 RepID=UPI003D231C75
MHDKVRSFLMPVYNRAPISFERGAGSTLFTADGTGYLDFGSGVAVNALGHGHPRLVDALVKQARKLWHTSNLYASPQQERLAQRLCELSFADRVFFCNSGTEAVELAIKAARRFHYVNGAPERNGTITIEGAFHGRTLAALTATGQQKYLEGFAPLPGGFDQVPFGNLAALERAITARTAAVLVEPMQGESGVRPMPPGYLRNLRALCDQYGILLLIDEVQTGIGRTGTFFAYEQEAIPDVLATAKGLGGGFPIGACLATEAVGAVMERGTHGSTFGGNPLAMAVATEVVDMISAPAFLARVTRASERFFAWARELALHYPQVFSEVRGNGLLMGLKCLPPVSDLVALAHEEKLLCLSAGDNVLRIAPPLIITNAEIDDGFGRLARAVARLAG